MKRLPLILTLGILFLTSFQLTRKAEAACKDTASWPVGLGCVFGFRTVENPFSEKGDAAKHRLFEN
jgi:hypothetical protein